MFYDKLKELCASKSIKPSRVAIECGFSKSAVSHWKSDGTIPQREILSKIADYFNVSVDYLLGNEEQKQASVSDNDIKFALFGEVADEIPDEKLQEVKNFAKYIKDTYKKDT